MRRVEDIRMVDKKDQSSKTQHKDSGFYVNSKIVEWHKEHKKKTGKRPTLEDFLKEWGSE